jgi:thiol-disulfide isomerase/thioredoxin
MKVNKCIRIIFILLIGLYGCKDFKKRGEDKYIHSAIDTSATVLISSDMDIPVGILRTASFSHFGNETVILTKAGMDTLSIPLNTRDLLMVSHKRMQGRDSIFIAPGDTLYLNFSENGTLNKSKVHRNTKKNSASFVSDEKNYTLKGELDSLSSLFYYMDSSQTMEFSNDYEKIKLHKMIFNHDYANGHQAQLHKLIKRKIDFFKNNSLKSGDMISTGLSRSKLFHELNLLYALSRQPDSLFMANMNLFINRDTPVYPFGQNYIEYAIYNIFFKELSDRSRAKIHYDQFAIYDSLPSYLDPPLVKYGRMMCLREMAEQSESFDRVSDYFDKFNSEYHDAKFENYFQNTYLTKLRMRYNSGGDMNLMDPIREVKTLTGILSENKGKVVYIDFWASWCAPCIDAMPAARKLREDYKNKDVIFLYVSTDRNYDKWTKASNLIGISDYFGNYLLLNRESSDMVKSWKLDYIPRYVLFDGNGKLINQNAPGPEGKEIRTTLNKYLTEISK